MHPVRTVLLTLMHTVYAGVTRHPILPGGRGADRWGRQLATRSGTASRQPLEARIAGHKESPVHQLPGGGARHETMPRIHFGQQGHVCGGKTAGEAVLGVCCRVTSWRDAGSSARYRAATYLYLPTRRRQRQTA